MEDPRASWVASGLYLPQGGFGGTEDPDDDALTALRRGGCGYDRWARRERVLGPSGFRPLFPLPSSVSLSVWKWRHNC